jgi:sulfur-oxidizing protein SoxX
MAVAAAAPTAGAAQGGELVCKKKVGGYRALVMTLPKPDLPSGAGIPASLSGALGDAGKGALIAANGDKGACLACHRIPKLGPDGEHGNLGPSLEGVGARFTEAQLRQLIVDASVLYPGTVMPSYHKAQAGPRVPAELAGKTILTAQEVEDVVAFLKGLK